MFVCFLLLLVQALTPRWPRLVDTLSRLQEHQWVERFWPPSCHCPPTARSSQSTCQRLKEVRQVLICHTYLHLFSSAVSSFHPPPFQDTFAFPFIILSPTRETLEMCSSSRIRSALLIGWRCKQLSMPTTHQAFEKNCTHVDCCQLPPAQIFWNLKIRHSTVCDCLCQLAKYTRRELFF